MSAKDPKSWRPERQPWLPVGVTALLLISLLLLRGPTEPLETAGILLTVVGVFIGGWIVLQLAIWRTPLVGMLGRLETAPAARIFFCTYAGVLLLIAAGLALPADSGAGNWPSRKVVGVGSG